jgi:hypothetical protein
MAIQRELAFFFNHLRPELIDKQWCYRLDVVCIVHSDVLSAPVASLLDRMAGYSDHRVGRSVLILKMLLTDRIHQSSLHWLSHPSEQNWRRSCDSDWSHLLQALRGVRHACCMRPMGYWRLNILDLSAFPDHCQESDAQAHGNEHASDCQLQHRCPSYSPGQTLSYRSRRQRSTRSSLRTVACAQSYVQ